MTNYPLVSRSELESELAGLPCFDRPGTLARLDNDEALLVELLDIFRDDSRNQLAELRSHCTSGDAAQMARGAHAIKGALGNIGAMQAHRVALELERAGKSGQVRADLLELLEQQVSNFLKTDFRG